MARLKLRKNGLLLLCFILFVAAVIIVPSAIILNTPVEVTSIAAGNFGCNLATGGYVLEDGGFLFYTAPGDRRLFRAETADIKGTAVQLADDCDGELQVVGDTYFFRSGDALISCDWDGKNRKTVLEYAHSAMLVGGSVYYIGEQGSICKYNNKYKKVTDYEIKPEGNIVYYYNAIYYVKDGQIRKLSVTSGNDTLFMEASPDAMFFDDKYIFYIEDGSAHSAIMTAEASMISNEIIEASQLAVIFDKMLYVGKDGGVYYADVNETVSNSEYTPQRLADAGSGIAADENGFYYFNNAGRLCSIAQDGSAHTEY